MIRPVHASTGRRMKRSIKPVPIRSEMTAPKAPRLRRHSTAVRLREYQDGNSTPIDMIECFLHEVYAATRSDISGATGVAWAGIQDVLDALETAGRIRVNKTVSPWEYSWKG